MRCFKKSLAVVALIAGAGNAAAREPVEAQRIAGTITGEDYPDAAMSGGERGTVTARFVVDPTGRVRDCIATAETDAPTLRLWTCFLISERFKFSPARDQEGRSISNEKTQRVTWQIPGRSMPVAAPPAPLQPFETTVDFVVSADGEVSDCTTTGSALEDFRMPNICERLRTVVPFVDAAGRPVAKQVIVTQSLRVRAAN